MTHLDKAIAWKRADGGISVTYIDDRDRIDGETDQQLIDRMSAKIGASDYLQGAVQSVINKSDVTATKEHRDCWDIKNGKIEVDAVKKQAKETDKAQKEAQRQSILSKLKISEEELDHILKR